MPIHAQQSYVQATYAPLASPALTGTPTAPTAAVGTNTTQIATTAFVLANGGGGGGTPRIYRQTITGNGSVGQTFTITHNLGNEAVALAMWDETDGVAIDIYDTTFWTVTNSTANQFTLTTDTLLTGQTRTVIVTG